MDSILALYNAKPESFLGLRLSNPKYERVVNVQKHLAKAGYLFLNREWDISLEIKAVEALNMGW